VTSQNLREISILLNGVRITASNIGNFVESGNRESSYLGHVEICFGASFSSRREICGNLQDLEIIIRHYRSCIRSRYLFLKNMHEVSEFIDNFAFSKK
jgi:hypothetical protein